MFAGGNDGTAYVIHMPTGTLLRTMPIPKAVVNGVVACGSDVIINALGATTIYARDGTQRRGLRGTKLRKKEIHLRNQMRNHREVGPRTPERMRRAKEAGR